MTPYQQAGLLFAQSVLLALAAFAAHRAHRHARLARADARAAWLAASEAERIARSLHAMLPPDVLSLPAIVPFTLPAHPPAAEEPAAPVIPEPDVIRFPFYARHASPRKGGGA